VRSFLSSVPLFLPGVLLAGVVALVLGRGLAVRLASRRWVASLLILSIGVILSATLTPLADALERGVASNGICDLDRIGWAPLRSYLAINEESMNVLMFVPLGIAIALVPGAPGRWLVASAFLLPFVIELLQMLVPALGRECEGADLVDNPTGLVIGLAIGWLAKTCVRATRARGSPDVG
jgi:glycopeptide antibiotics resistance protein